MSDQNQEEYNKAMEELDAIEKSSQPEEDELDALTKSLEEELGEDLSKSEKDDDKDDDDKDDDEKDEGGEPEGFGKSEDEEFADELIKASEAYASLEKSVQEGIGGVFAELDAMKKSMAAMMNLNIKQAKVIAEMSKSRKEETDAISKSLQNIGSAPVAPGKAVLGIGASEQTEQLQKSVSEVTELLVKAANAGSIDARYLSIYGTHKNIACLPDSVKTTIGL